MESSNLENDNDYKTEFLLDFVEDISPLVFSNKITDDNISKHNGLSGLNQVILFETGKYLDDIYDLDFVRAAILVQVAFMKKELEEDLMDEEDLFDDVFKELYNKDENLDEENPKDGEDPYKGKPYIDDGYDSYEDDIDDYDNEYRKEYYDYDFDDERFQAKIKRIAIGTLAGMITLDNPSEINGLTGYEQAIYYVAHLLPAENEEERKKIVEKIDRKVQAYYIDLEGGYDLISMINNY